MRRFLSPGERALLERLERRPRACETFPTEGAFARALMDELDARLIPADEPETVGSMGAQLDLLSPWGRRAA